jgi:hypothetical protein
VIRVVLFTSVLAACGNDAADYAKFLHRDVSCVDLSTKAGRRSYGDVALCFRNLNPHTPSEYWLCTSQPLECRIVGEKIRYALVVPQVPAQIPAEVPHTESK